MGLCTHESQSRSRQAQSAEEETHDREEGRRVNKVIVGGNGGRPALKQHPWIVLGLKLSWMTRPIITNHVEYNHVPTMWRTKQAIDFLC